MDRQQMERCLEQVAAYRVSGQKAHAWAAANGVSMRAIASWCAHARRWQARLDGVRLEPRPAPKPGSFVAARVAPGAGAPSCVRVEFSAGAVRLDLHWPLAHSGELASLLRELGR